MKVEVWSDVVCPWCYLGKRRLEATLEEFPDEVEVVWRSFELDPAAPRRREGSAADHLAAKYGMTHEQVAASWERLTALGEADGIEYRLASTQGGSSFDAHRLVKLAARHGKSEEAVERLFRAYFTEGLPIGERETVSELGREVGLPGDEVDELFAGDELSEDVRADERRAMELGIQGVPFFAIDDRYAVSGAQTVEVLLEALTAAKQTSAMPEPSSAPATTSENQ
jgi:predicted DsbA family dithiol-disulfide isomerase